MHVVSSGPLLVPSIMVSPANIFAEPMEYDTEDQALLADPVDHDAATNTSEVKEAGRQDEDLAPAGEYS